MAAPRVRSLRTADDASGRSPARRARLIAMLAAAALVLGVIGVATAVYTERPQFCPTCHEMGPYYDAWAAGPHVRTSCVDCHIDPGIVAHGLHKFVALKEVWDHFTKDNRFPTWGVELPNSRCLRCHTVIRTLGGSRFSHALHADKAACKECHPAVGHAVSTAALDAAGILNVGAGGPALPGGLTASTATGHIKVSCQRCHDQAKMRCSQCHTAPHEARGECSGCHQPGQKFAFAHTTATACQECHQPPANHFAGPCATCHTTSVPFASATFSHTGNTGIHDPRSFPCAKCHPQGFTSASCTCHGGKPPTGD